jgi:hypothetical protein
MKLNAPLAPLLNPIVYFHQLLGRFSSYKRIRFTKGFIINFKPIITIFKQLAVSRPGVKFQSAVTLTSRQ